MASGRVDACGQFTLNGSAQQFTGAGSPPRQNVTALMLKNMSAVNTVYFGTDNSVSATTGFPIDPKGVVPIDIINPKDLWLFGTNLDKVAWATVKP